MNLEKIVCHRGFHDPRLEDPGRPVENSLGAYEKAWQNFSLCECDITCTKDGELVLCHDATFGRVLDKLPSGSDPLADTPVYELTAAQVASMRLSDGSAPALLSEVLALARRMSRANPGAGTKYLVVELKKDAASEMVIKSLTKFLEEHPELAFHVAVIMSFDLSMMKAMSQWRSATPAKEAIAHVKLMILTEAPAHYDAANNTVLSDVKSPTFRKDCLQIVRDNGLDGAYLEFQEEMVNSAVLSVQEDKVRSELASLAATIALGVWNYSETQPDGLTTLKKFDELGFLFVNSDLPDDELIFLGLTTSTTNFDTCFDGLVSLCGFGR